MDNAFTRTPQEVLAHFQVTEQGGLSNQAVVASREKYGRNGMLPSTRNQKGCKLTDQQPSRKILQHHSGSSYWSSSKIN